MTKIFETVNGQLEFDFDYLLNFTNECFVDCVRKSLVKLDAKKVDMNEDSVTVEVVIYSEHVVVFYDFNKITKEISHNVMTISEIKKIASFYAGEENGC